MIKILLPEQRQLRHLRGVYVRNIIFQKNIDMFFTISIEKNGKDKVIYKSNLFEHSLNPSWTFDEHEFTVEGYLSADEATHKVYDHNQCRIPQQSYQVQNQTVNNSIITTSPASYRDGSNLSTPLIPAPLLSSQSSISSLHHVSSTNTLSTQDGMITSSIFSLDSLQYIEEKMSKVNTSTLPKNCIILEFIDGIFVSKSEEIKELPADIKSIEKKLERESKIVPVQNSGKQNSNDMFSFVTPEEMQLYVSKLLSVKESIIQSDESIEQMKKKIEESLKKQEKMLELKQNIELRKSRICRLKKEIEEKNKRLEEAKWNTETYEKELQEKTNLFNESKKLLVMHQKNLSEQQKHSLPQLREQLSQLESRIKQRQRIIIRNLQIIYPITINQKGSYYMINGLSIYKGETLGTDEETASGLGYVAHCVRILSKLLHIPLKFQVFPLASRSFVRDEVSGDQNQRAILPLFLVRGSEKPKYFRAVILLNLNIYHLLKMNGTKARLKNKHDILENLLYLFDQLS